MPDGKTGMKKWGYYDREVEVIDMKKWGWGVRGNLYRSGMKMWGWIICETQRHSGMKKWGVGYL